MTVQNVLCDILS